jgi:hypothetical protein
MPIKNEIFYDVYMIDKDLALTIFTAFDKGEKVSDEMLYKAASTIGLPTQPLIKEAVLKTVASTFIKRAQKFTANDLAYFSSACGYSPSEIIKVALLSDSTPEEVVFTHLSAVNYVPHEKFAEAGNPQGQALQQDPSLLGNPQLPPSALTSQDMMGNLLYQPSPTAPSQVPPSDNGNMEQLVENHNNKDQIQAEQEQAASDQMLQQNPQPQLPKEQIEQALSTADSMAKARYISPGATEEQLARLSQEIDAVEAQAGIAIKDPAQLKKVLQGIEKQEKKLIDEAIKSRTEMVGGQQEQQMGPLPGTEQNPLASQNPTAAPQMEAKMASLLKIASKLRFK